MKTHAILWNPNAGRGTAQALAERLRAALRAQGIETQLQATSGRGFATEFAQALGDEVERLYVVGGDGTLREAAAGVLRRKIPLPLAHLPLGNANVIARELGISLDLDRAIPELIAGEPAPFDVMWADDHLVLAVVGMGFDGEAAALLDRARNGALKGWYRWNGDSLYGAVGMFTLLKPGWRRLSLRVDGKALAGAFTGCMVSNMRTYAKGWAPNPGADAQDGVFDYQALRPSLVPSTALSLVAAARKKNLSPRLAAQGRGRVMEIEAEVPFYWQADGDPMPPGKTLRIELQPGVLPLIVPAP